ncbi:MAG: sulfatase [Rikenellaceae bacterium]
MNIKQTLLVGGAICAAASAATAAQKQPNIIFILVDDLGYADVGFNGSTYFETPNIDALAAQSVIFDNSYMYPTSSPSRTALFTGQQSFRTGVYTVPVLENGNFNQNIYSRWTVSTDYPLYSEVLADVGYRSVHLGKWHIVGPDPLTELAAEYPFKSKLGQPQPGDFSWVEEHKNNPEISKYYPEERGFEKNVGGTYRGDPALIDGGYKHPDGGFRAPFTNPFIEQKEGDEWLTDRLTDEALEFMSKCDDAPFFINLHYYAVHRPLVKRSEELYQKYINKEGDEVLGQGVGPNREEHAIYATMIESVDDNIGRIMEYLEREGLTDDTVIVFSSDNGHNGLASDNRQIRGAKGDIYEGGVKVPTFVHWGDRYRSRTVAAPITSVDYFPTFLELAGVKGYNGVVDGDSFLSVLKKERKGDYERPIFWQLSSQYKYKACTAVRVGDYKLIQYLASGIVELFNLATDPMESNNIAESSPEVRDRLVKLVTDWRQSNDMLLPANTTVE